MTDAKSPAVKNKKRDKGKKHSDRRPKAADTSAAAADPAAMSVGKSVCDALKENFARTMAATFADYIISLTDQKYTLSEKEEEEESDDDDESRGKRSKKDSIDDIAEEKEDTFVGSDVGKRSRRRATGAKCRLPAKIELWLTSAEEAFKSFANFLLTLGTSSDGKTTLTSLYQEDVRKTVKAVMYRQHLFDNASPLAKGLARFDTHINLLPSDRISVLDSSIAVETDSATPTLISFKSEIKELLCPRVADLLKHLSPDSAASVFSDVVKYVEKSFSFYTKWGDLPGTEFRILLADINIKILSKSEDNAAAVLAPLHASSSASKQETRAALKALQKIREWKPLSKDYPSRLDKARDVVLIPGDDVSRIPVTPTTLLQLVSYVNALLSLEQRRVFTNGFFNAACVLISQRISGSGGYKSSESPAIRPSKLAAKIAKDNLLRISVVKPNKEEEEEEEESSGSESSSSSEDEQESKSQLRDLIYKTGGFFFDTSEFGKKIRSLITSRDHVSLINYASSVIDSDSKIAVQRLVASLLDIAILQAEQCEELKKMCSCHSSSRRNTTNTTTLTEIVRMILNPNTDKNEMVKQFLNVAEPSVVSGHEAYVLTERLLPSKNDIGTVVLSFFKVKNHEPPAAVSPESPDLLKFTKHLLDAITKCVVKELDKIVSSSGQQKINVNAFVNSLSPLNIQARIKSALTVTDDGGTTILFSPEVANNVAGLKLTSLINAVKESAQVESIRQSAADLQDPDNAALSLLLFPPFAEGNDDDVEISALSDLAKGLLSIAEGSIGVVRSRHFDDGGGGGGSSSYALVMDTTTMNKAVTLAASSLENATAKVLYADEDMHPSRVLQGASVIRGSLSHVLDRASSEESPKPTTSLAKYTMTDITNRYLKRMKRKKPAESDRALVAEVTNRATDIVKAQLANSLGLGVIMSAAVKILEADLEEAETRSMNNQPASFRGTRSDVARRVGVIRNFAHLCVTTAVAAASNMSRLSNQHFFDFVKEANAIVTNNASGAASEKLHDRRDERRGKRSSGGGENAGGAATSVWLRNAIESITGVVPATAPSESCADPGVMDKLEEMIC